MLLALTLSTNLVIPVASFLAIGALTWLILSFFTSDDDRAGRRLGELSDPRNRTNNDRDAKKGESIARVLQKASPALAKPLTPTTEAEMGKLRQSLVEAGFRGESAAVVYLSIRAACAMLFLAIGGGVSVYLYGATYAALIRLFIVGAIGFYLPILALRILGSKRKQQIFLGLPDALDLMVVCVEAGLGLDQAMRRVAQEMKKSYRIVADEFGLCNLHLQMGRAKAQVLQDLGRFSQPTVDIYFYFSFFATHERHLCRTFYLRQSRINFVFHKFVQIAGRHFGGHAQTHNRHFIERKFTQCRGIHFFWQKTLNRVYFPLRIL